jgi:O-antigen/teichoic acid export membrane protein
MAQSLTEAPHRLSTAIINQVSLPVFSKLQHDRSLLTAHFLKISKYLAVVSLPVQGGLILVAPELVPVLLSPKWEAIIVPFQLFCLEGTVILSTLTCSPLLTARGRATLLFNRSFLAFVWLAGSALVGAPFGLVGVATARLITVIPIRLALFVPTLRELQLSPASYLRSLASPLQATAIMTVFVLLVRHTWPLYGGQLGLLLLSVATGAVTYSVALFLLDRSFGSEIRTAAHDLFSTSKA